MATKSRRKQQKSDSPAEQGTALWRRRISAVGPTGAVLSQDVEVLTGADWVPRPTDRPIVDRLIRECNVSAEKPEYFTLRTILEVVVSTARGLRGSGVVKAIERLSNTVSSFETIYGLSTETISKIQLVITKYLVDESEKRGYNLDPMENKAANVAAAHTLLGNGVEDLSDSDLNQLLVAVAGEIIKRWEAQGAIGEPRLDDAATETTTPAPAAPRPDLSPDQVKAAMKALTLDRLQERFEKQLREIELPEGGFTTIEQARAGSGLATTFQRLQKRRTELGLSPVEKPDRVTEAARMATQYYDHHTKTGEFIPPKRRGRPRKVVQAGAASTP